MNNPYINILESEEMQFYLRDFGGILKKNPTVEKYKNLNKEKLEILYKEVINKTSKLSKRERDLVIYFATKN